MFTTIDIPDGSKQQQAWGINDKGQVAVFTDIGASYIYCTRDVLCPHGGKTVADGRTWKASPGASLHYDSALPHRLTALVPGTRFLLQVAGPPVA